MNRSPPEHEKQSQRFTDIITTILSLIAKERKT